MSISRLTSDSTRPAELAREYGRYVGVPIENPYDIQ